MVCAFLIGPLQPNPEAAVLSEYVGGLPPSLWAALLFWNKMAVLRVLHPGRDAPAAYPFERLIEGCLSHEQSSLFLEQLAGLPRLGFGRFTFRGKRL